MPPSREPDFLAFAATRKRELGGLFVAVAAIVVGLFVAESFGVLSPGEPGGWLLIFAALPWSIVVSSIPNPIAPAAIAVGLGINVALTTAIVWYAVARWIAVLRSGPPSDQ
jgi:hypothetical protein